MSTVKAYTLPTGSVAAEWTTEAGTEVQAVAWSRSLLLGVRRTGGEWVNITVVEPERFGEFQTVKQIKRWAESFIALAEEEVE